MIKIQDGSRTDNPPWIQDVLHPGQFDLINACSKSLKASSIPFVIDEGKNDDDGMGDEGGKQ